MYGGTYLAMVFGNVNRKHAYLYYILKSDSLSQYKDRIINIQQCQQNLYDTE